MTNDVPTFRFIDLFAGIGGFHHALSSPEFGGDCVLAVDIEESCRDVYRSTWPHMSDESVVGDIRALTMNEEGKDRTDQDIDALIPDHEVLCAGFPCQPFSKSGAQMGILDSTRGTLFFEILRIAQVKRPQFLLLENVRNLAGPRHTDTWTTIIRSLRALGYRVSETPVVFSPHLLPLTLNGRPQSRDRVFILAQLVDAGEELTQQPLAVRGPVGDWDPNKWDIEEFLLDDTTLANIDDYKLRGEEVAWLNAWQAFIQGIPDNDLPGFPIWVDAFKSKPDVPAGTPAWKADFLRKNSEFFNKHRTFIRSWLRRSWIPG